MKKRLLVPLEVKIRELDSKLILILNLLKNSNNDWEIIFGYYKNINQFIEKDKSNIPFILLLKGMENYYSFFEKIFNSKGKIVLLDEEGGVFSKYEEKYFPRVGYDNSLIQYIEKVFLWGNNEKENWLKRHQQMNENKGVVSGNPRFEISKKFYFKYFEKLNDIKNHEKIILISAAFGLGNALIDPLVEAEYWKKKQGGENHESLWKPIAKYEKKLIKIFINDIKKLALFFKEYTFIFRSHPVEDNSIYYDSFNGVSNIKIIENSSVQNWFPKTSLLIHNGCTTAIESCFAGIQPICYSPIVETNYTQYLTFDCSDVVYNYDDLLIKVKNKLNNLDFWDDKKLLSIENKLVNHIENFRKIFSKEHDTCFKKITSEIDKIDLIKWNYPIYIQKFTIKKYIPILVKDFILNLLSGFKYFTKKKLIAQMKSRNTKKFNSLTINEIEKRIKLYLKIDTTIPKINISQIDSMVYSLKKYE